MDYIQEIFERANLQEIVAFIIYGCESSDIESGTYIERLNDTEKSFFKLIRSKCDDWDTQNEIEMKFTESAAIWESVYTEIGMKVAFKLFNQISNSE